MQTGSVRPRTAVRGCCQIRAFRTNRCLFHISTKGESMNKVLLITLFCLVPFCAFAESKYETMRQKQNSCGELSSYRLLDGCYSDLLDESDALLNKEYSELIGYLKGVNKANLVDAQRKWIKFRDADCLFSDPREEDGSIASANKSACLADRTIERLNHLEQYNAPSNKGCNGCPW